MAISPSISVSSPHTQSMDLFGADQSLSVHGWKLKELTLKIWIFQITHLKG
jgi:hypothetical protein